MNVLFRRLSIQVGYTINLHTMRTKLLLFYNLTSNLVRLKLKIIGKAKTISYEKIILIY